MSSTQVILLERIENLGNLGDVVSVKPGFARNYLLPQKKALRASNENMAYFEAQKKHIEAENDKKKAEAEKLAAKLEGAKVAVLGAASEAGQLYGSVTSRDIAEQATAETGVAVDRHMIKLNDNFKTIGLFPVNVNLHPEVKVEIIVNIARTAEEAQVQAETGRALIADLAQDAEEEALSAEEAEEKLAEALSDDALEAEKAKKAEEAEAEAEAEAKAAEKAAKKAEKEAAKAEAEAADAEAEEGSEEDAAAAEEAEEDKTE